MLEGKRCWCVVEGSKFSVYTDRTEGKENMMMELRVDTASCDLHVVKNLRERTAAIVQQQQPLASLAPQPNQSVRTENSKGSHVTTMSSPEQPKVTLENPLVSKIPEPTIQPAVRPLASTFAGYRELRTAPKQLQRNSNRFVFNKNNENLSVDDMADLPGDLARYSQQEGGKQFPSFTLKTKTVNSKVDECVEHTFRCTSARNVEAAEWVDAVVRARGQAIRARKGAVVQGQAQKGVQNENNPQNYTAGQKIEQPRRRVLELTTAPLNALAPLDMNAHRGISSPRTPRSSCTSHPHEPLMQLRKWNEIDALTIPLNASKSDGTRRALQIDRHSQDYQDI